MMVRVMVSVRAEVLKDPWMHMKKSGEGVRVEG